MPGISDTATVTLNVNGAQAKQMLAELQAKIQQTEATIDSMQKAMANPKDIEKAKKQLKDYKKQLSEMESATEGVNRALGNLEGATPRELERSLRTLNRQLKDMVPGSEVWDSHCEKIREVKARLAELKSEVGQQQSAWQKFMEWSQGAWPALDLIKGWVDDLVGAMRKYVDAYASMDQEMANVRKFTGMTADEVEELNEELKKIDTRTSREDLNKLAQEAGRLGKSSQEDVLGFVRAADKINVALDDLGEGATLTISKLTGVFGVEDTYGTEQSLLKVGSVVNELSQNCAASAPYLTNFTERMGGVGSQAGMTIQQIMGLGAVLDSNAQQVEASATAVSQVLVRMMTDPAKYARVAGLEVDAFADKLRTDANGALLEFLETLNKAGNMDALAPMFKDMGETGARAITALSTLASKIDDVKAQQEAANIAFEQGTSINAEFSVQNNTVQASLEKCRNAANELRVALGEKLYPLMSHFIKGGTALVKALSIALNFLQQNIGTVITLTAAIAAYTVAVNAAVIRQTVWNGLIAAGRGIQLLWAASCKLCAAAVALFSGNITKAKRAWTAFSLTLKASPIGLLAAAITAATAALIAFAVKAANARSESAMLAKAQQDVAKADKEAEANCKAELTTLEALYTATQNQSLAMDARLRAVDKLQQQYPDYFKNLTQEEILAGKAADAYERLRKNIIRSAQAEARKSLLAETSEEIAKIEAERDQELADIYEKHKKGNETQDQFEKRVEGLRFLYDDRGAIIGRGEGAEAQRRVSNAKATAANKLRPLLKKQELLARAVSDDTVESLNNNNNNGTINPEDPPKTDPKTTPDRFAAEKAARERAEAEARIAYATGQTLYSEYTARMATIAADYYEDLLTRTDLSADERLKIEADFYEALKKENESATKLTLDDEERSHKELLASLQASYAARLQQEGLSAAERQHVKEQYDETLELAELNHLARIVNLYEEGSDEYLEAQRKFQDKELAAQERHLKKMENLEKTYADIKKKHFGLNQPEKDEEYNKQSTALKTVYEQELAAVGDNEAEKLRIKEAYLAAEKALRQEYNQEIDEETSLSFQGAMQKAADWLQGDGGKTLSGALSTAVSGMSAIFSSLSSLIQAELDIQTNAIEKRYKKEVQAAQGNTFLVAKLEEQKEAEIAKVKNEASKKQFTMQVIQAVAQTATNALAAFGSAAQVPIIGYVLAPIAAAMAVAAGAIQIAAIKKQQQAAAAQGYAEGGFTGRGGKYEPAGIVHKGEWVASQKLLASPIARPMIEALDYAQRTNTIGSLRSEDVSRAITANHSLVRIAESDNGSLVMAAVASRMSEAVADLTDRLREPFVTVNTITGDHGIKKAQDEYNQLMKNKSPKYK